jgi:hypothetical protein
MSSKYNYAHDVALPDSGKPPLVYFMYPQAETAEGRVDPFDPDNFKYEITVKELASGLSAGDRVVSGKLGVDTAPDRFIIILIR